MTASLDNGQDFFCSSARFTSGARPLGIVGPDGTVGFVVPPLPVDERFVERARQGRAPERRFRFINRCIEDACGYWTSDCCGAINAAVAALADDAATEMRPCAIRASCL